jgi:hypothetical protein
MSELIDIIEAKIDEFDALREVFSDEASRCFLLIKRDFQTSDYEILFELESGYYFEFSKAFNHFNLQYATVDREFVKLAQTYTHIALDGIVYQAAKPRVVIPPTGEEPFYQILCLQTDPPEYFTPE